MVFNFNESSLAVECLEAVVVEQSLATFHRH